MAEKYKVGLTGQQVVKAPVKGDKGKKSTGVKTGKDLRVK